MIRNERSDRREDCGKQNHKYMTYMYVITVYSTQSVSPYLGQDLVLPCCVSQETSMYLHHAKHNLCNQDTLSLYSTIAMSTLPSITGWTRSDKTRDMGTRSSPYTCTIHIMIVVY